MLSSSEEMHPIEGVISNLMRANPMTPNNALEYMRLGQKIVDAGNIMKSLANHHLQMKLKIHESE